MKLKSISTAIVISSTILLSACGGNETKKSSNEIIVSSEEIEDSVDEILGKWQVDNHPDNDKPSHWEVAIFEKRGNDIIMNRTMHSWKGDIDNLSSEVGTFKNGILDLGEEKIVFSKDLDSYSYGGRSFHKVK